MGLHDQHRQRMKERFLREGLDGFQDHEALEMLLYYAIPQKDTNALAHTLLERFGSLPDVFEASHEELCAVKGVGAHAAGLLRMMPGLLRRYYDRIDRKSVVLSTTEDIVAFLHPQFLGRTTEWVYLICLNQKGEITYSGFLFEGSVTAVAVRMREIVAACLRSNATGAILAHNHPGGLALPSADDLDTTKRVWDALRTIEVRLWDHIILSATDAVSMRDSGHFLAFCRK